VTEVLARLQTWGVQAIVQMEGVNETTTFKIPIELMRR